MKRIFLTPGLLETVHLQISWHKRPDKSQFSKRVASVNMWRISRRKFQVIYHQKSMKNGFAKVPGPFLCRGSRGGSFYSEVLGALHTYTTTKNRAIGADHDESLTIHMRRKWKIVLYAEANGCRPDTSPHLLHRLCSKSVYGSRLPAMDTLKAYCKPPNVRD